MIGFGVTVDQDRCLQVGEFLKTLHFPVAEEEDLYDELPAQDLRMFYFIVVAICHQTTPIGRPRLDGTVNGGFRYGWDYLCECWMEAAKADPYILTREWLLTAQASDIITILYDKERGSTIYNPEGRAALLRDLGAGMYQDGIRHVDEYYQKSGGWLTNKGGIIGLEHMLSRFEAYGKDPVKKKLTFFLILMNRYGFWEYRDIENLGAPVDYHEMRLHLRLGTVKIMSAVLEERIRQGTVLGSEEDVMIRRAIYDAIFKIARRSGRTPADLHYFFWNMARNCCKRDETHCVSCGKHGSLPERYEALLNHAVCQDHRGGHRLMYAGKRCVFAENCASATLPHAEKMREPIVDTDLY